MIRIVSFDDRCVKDHGAIEGEKKTLCGRQLKGIRWFYRGNSEFKGDMGFYCAQCCAAFRRMNGS